MADIQDEIELIHRLEGVATRQVSAESIAETAELPRPSDAGDKPVQNALVNLKPPRPPRRRKSKEA